MRSKITFITVFIMLAFALSLPVLGQLQQNATIPFDFAEWYFKTNGVIPDAIVGHRNGMDGLSVFDKTPNEIYSNVRVLATVPAYDQFGNPIFWYPVGDLSYKSFTPDKVGYYAREKARNFPMYIFPDPRREGFTMFTGHRHAPVMDLTMQQMPAGPLPYTIGIRMVYTVYYTEKSRQKDSLKLMQYFGEKNGWDAVDTPVIKSVDDLRFLEKQGMIDVKPLWTGEFPQPDTAYTIAPIFTDATGGAIYPDAMLFMTMKDGKVLPTEMIFENQFVCLKKIGKYCERRDDTAF